MTRRTAALFSLFLAGMTAARADAGGHEHKAHEHGVAHLDVVMEGGAVHLGLNSPAVNLIGFEHDPADAAERAALARALADLKQGAALMTFTPAARCAQKRVLVQSGLHDHAHDADRGHGHEGEDDGHDHEHADIRVFWEIACARVDALREIDIQGLFQRFPSVQRLRVQAVLPGGQTAAELTAAAAKLRVSR